ncbi:MAG TPA: hypothetical protein VGP89_17860 [Candidatus Angelobacter sp.]|jgi:hypothetical protein|nr:hypothetical protein [Candidatus Angelobacter sp.]
MDEQARVKKAIADRAVPFVDRASDEDLKRYSLRPEEFYIHRGSTPVYRMPFDALGFNGVVHANNSGDMPRGNSLTFDRLNEGLRAMYEPGPEPVTRVVDIMNEYMNYSMMYGSGLYDTGDISRRGMGISPLSSTTAVLEPPPEIPRPSKDILQRFQVEEQNVTDMRSELATEAETMLGYSVLRKRLGMQSPLTTALLKLEIEPFDAASVKAYKDEMLKYAQNEAAIMDAKEGISRHSWQARQAIWRTSDIDGYSKPIPEYVIEKALQIKKACPEVQFQIEELTVVPDPFLIAVLGKVRRYIEVWDEPKFEGSL